MAAMVPGGMGVDRDRRPTYMALQESSRTRVSAMEATDRRPFPDEHGQASRCSSSVSGDPNSYRTGACYTTLEPFYFIFDQNCVENHKNL
jgi:hypothetical protein